MTTPQDEFPAIAQAVREGINDAYRLGMGTAISVLCEYRGRTTDPITLDAAIAHLQMLSVRTGSRA